MRKILVGLFLIQSYSLFAESSEVKAKKENLVNFKSIKRILQNDRLGHEVVKKQKKKKNLRRQKVVSKIKKYNIPNEDEFWGLLSELWLVKNAALLKWDFKKPEYGIDQSFRLFLENLGIYEKKFKILFVNSPDVTHFALPSIEGEIIFILSVPFIRTLDLSKLEISVLLFEDYLRSEFGYLKNFVMTKEMKKFLGGNFVNQKLPKKLVKDVLDKYQKIVFEKGFNFQQQFTVTKRMNAMLRPTPKIWNAYYRLLGKIDELIKINILYKKYTKIYPSPELQINWLKPGSKKNL